MASVFERKTLHSLDLRGFTGLSPEEETLRGELLGALRQVGGGLAISDSHVKRHIIGELHERIGYDSEWILDELEAFIRWDDVVRDQLERRWSSVTLSNGSVWWYRNEMEG